MEDDPFAPSWPKMMISPSSNFKPKFEDHEYMELVWENGQILTRGRRSSDYCRGSTQNPRTTSLLDLYETDYFDVLKRNSTGDVPDKNLGDTQVVPARENPSSDSKSPARPDGVLTGESGESMEVEPETEPGVPELEVPENKNDVEAMLITEAANGVKAMADPMNQKNLPPDAESVAMGRTREMEGTRNKEKESSDLIGWSTEWRGASSSSSSSGTSEDHICSMGRTYEDSEGSTHLSRNLDDESDDVGAQVPARTRKAMPKRRRRGDIDNICKQEQRHQINKRMRTLQKLLPNSDKDDKAELLDDAIVYMRKLQLYLQFRMMMANGFVAPHMMLPLGHYSPVGLGIGTPQFLPPPVLGFPNQPGMTPMSCSSFFGPTEASSQQSVLPPSVPLAASSSSRHFQRSFSMPSLDGSTNRLYQPTVDGSSTNLQMSEFSQVKNENPECRRRGAF